MEGIINFFRDRKNFLNVVALGILALGVPVAIQLASQTAIFSPRAAAAKVEFIVDNQKVKNLLIGGQTKVVATGPQVDLKITSPFGPRPTTTALSQTSILASSSNLFSEGFISKAEAVATLNNHSCICGDSNGPQGGQKCADGTTPKYDGYAAYSNSNCQTPQYPYCYTCASSGGSTGGSTGGAAGTCVAAGGKCATSTGGLPGGGSCSNYTSYEVGVPKYSDCDNTYYYCFKGCTTGSTGGSAGNTGGTTIPSITDDRWVNRDQLELLGSNLGSSGTAYYSRGGSHQVTIPDQGWSQTSVKVPAVANAGATNQENIDKDNYIQLCRTDGACSGYYTIKNQRPAPTNGGGTGTGDVCDGYTKECRDGNGNAGTQWCEQGRRNSGGACVNDPQLTTRCVLEKGSTVQGCKVVAGKPVLSAGAWTGDGRMVITGNNFGATKGLVVYSRGNNTEIIAAAADITDWSNSSITVNRTITSRDNSSVRETIYEGNWIRVCQSDGNTCSDYQNNIIPPLPSSNGSISASIKVNNSQDASIQAGQTVSVSVNASPSTATVDAYWKKCPDSNKANCNNDFSNKLNGAARQAVPYTVQTPNNWTDGLYKLVVNAVNNPTAANEAKCSGGNTGANVDDGKWVDCGSEDQAWVTVGAPQTPDCPNGRIKIKCDPNAERYWYCTSTNPSATCYASCADTTPASVCPGGQSTPTPTPSPSQPTVLGTRAYKISDTASGLGSATEVPFSTTSETMIITNYTFPDPSLGPKIVYVRFIRTDGVTEDAPAVTIDLVGPPPQISSIKCSADSSNNKVKFDIRGINFGNRAQASTITTDSGTATATNWANTAIDGAINTTPDPNKNYTITVTTADGQQSTNICRLNTLQITLGAKIFCRSPQQHSLSNVELVIKEVGASGRKFKETVTISPTNNPNIGGLITNIQTKLIEGQQYIMSLKPPRGLRSATQPFTAVLGTISLPDFLLPFGDIAPPPNGDGIINSLDKTQLTNQWGTLNTVGQVSGDFNLDNRVNSIDWACMRYDFNKSDDPEP